MDWNVWGAPIAVMAFGLLGGLVLTVLSRGAKRRDPSEEAWALKASLVDQLRSLQADREKIPEAVYALRFGRLLDEAARALRDAENMDAGGNTTDEVVPSTTDVPKPNPWPRRAGWSVAVLLFFTAMGVVLHSSTSDRGDGIMTGGDRIGPTAIEKQLKQLNEAHTENPEDMVTLNRLTHIAIQQGDLGAAMAWMDKARAIEPEHPEVRTHLAILQTSIGMTAQAKTELEIALKADPELSKAHLWLGLIALRNGDREGAIPSLESALEHADNAEDRAMASRALAEARRPPAQVMLKGSLALAPGLGIPSSGVLFVMVRASPMGGGPPVAAVRLDPRGVPGTFSITDRDLMMGGDWPEQVWVDARIDSDGDPSTKSDSDLTAPRTGPFTPGATGANLVLQGSNEAEPDASPRLAGTIEVADGVDLPKSGSVFIIIRRTSTTSGPPVAAVRLDHGAIPGPFSASDTDIMMGGSWPDEVWVQVRADADGNAMTKEDADVSSAVLGPFKAGTVDATITLGR